MGRSSGFCFRIIACGSDSVDRDASSENKSSDKRGWSFRKRSAGHHVLSSTVITEIPSENKNSEPVIINYEAPVSSVSEKTPANLWTEELPRVSTSTTKDNTMSNLDTEVADENEIKFHSSLDESAVIVIQSAVRKYLAQTELMRHKKIVELQAVVRGHLVRCRAAGTLRCIQSIVKMQALVRAGRGSIPLENTSIRKKEKQDSRTIPHPTYISIEKLLSNQFAIQLLESTPRTKQISIKCDPSKDDLAWKWLERWTSVSSPQFTDPHASKQVQDKVIDTKNQIENIDFEQKSDFLYDETKHSNTGSEIGPEKPVVDDEQPKRPSKMVATEQADSGGKKPVIGSRKMSNPAFIAAHSRFESLTSKNKSLTSTNSSNHEHIVYESLKLGHTRNGGSECGTELSVTSMLDSPDPSEIGNVECNKESEVLDKAEHASLGTELTHSISNLSENYDCNTSYDHIELEPETGRQMFKSSMHKEAESLETSPRGHVTASEHQVTPSSQISNNKKTKKVPTRKLKPWSDSKKSPVISNHASGLRNSLDHLPRESKPANRRNSFGSQNSEPNDQEPRDSCSSNSLPSYMQITESAKAKALSNNSPRSSPDVQGKEAYLKKRHSLPGSVSGRHGSPRVKRTPQQTTKRNDNSERKLKK